MLEEVIPPGISILTPYSHKLYTSRSVPEQHLLFGWVRGNGTAAPKNKIYDRVQVGRAVHWQSVPHPIVRDQCHPNARNAVSHSCHVAAFEPLGSALGPLLCYWTSRTIPCSAALVLFGFEPHGWTSGTSYVLSSDISETAVLLAPGFSAGVTCVTSNTSRLWSSVNAIRRILRDKMQSTAV